MELSGNTFKEYALKLGRTEEFINKLESYASTLTKQSLPIIYSPQHLALLMGKEYEELNGIIQRRETYYKTFQIKKKSGGTRQILAPQGELKRVQYWVKQFILDKLIFPDYVTAYQCNKSILANATPHVNKELVIKFDLKNYFDTILQSKVYGLFKKLGYHSSVAVDLAKICCVSKKLIEEGETVKRIKSVELFDIHDVSALPQGAPTSPALSNLAAFKLDLRLVEYAKKNEYSYTRYADDLTFSGSIEKKLKKSLIKKVVEDEGFILNEKKGCYAYKSNKQLVTGLTVNHRVSIPKKKRRAINTHLHNCIQFGPYNHLKKIKMEHKANYRDWLLGNILYIYSINPVAAKKMKEKFDRINWL